MLRKWKYNRPTKFDNYLTLPSRYDLASLLLGNYNYCLSYQQVAEAVAMSYANASDHLRAEMITSSVIAHRRGRQVSGFDGWDTKVVVSNYLARAKSAPGKHYAFVYDFDRGRAHPALSV